MSATGRVGVWKGMTGKVHGVVIRLAEVRTSCGIPIKKSEVFMTDNGDGDAITCQVCRDILDERR